MSKKIFFTLFIFFTFLFIDNVFATPLENCSNASRYIDYTSIYDSLGNNSNLKHFYSDFKDWFDNQNDYSYYSIFAQGSNDNLVHYYIVIYKNQTNFNTLTHSFSTRYRNFNIGFITPDVWSNIRYLDSTDLIFDSSNFQSGMLPSVSFSGGIDSFPRVSNTYFYTYSWVYSSLENNSNGSIIFIDTNNSISIGNSTEFINIKINDNYYCSFDDFPFLSSLYNLYQESEEVSSDLVYLPISDFSSYDTYIYLDNNTIRAIKDNTCTDYNISNHYNKVISSCVNFDYSNYVLINQQNLTNDFLYRLDISSFIILLLFMFLIVVYIPYYVFSSFFRKRRF